MTDGVYKLLKTQEARYACFILSYCLNNLKQLQCAFIYFQCGILCFNTWKDISFIRLFIPRVRNLTQVLVTRKR